MAYFPLLHILLVGYHHIHLQALQGRDTASWIPVQHLTQLGMNQSLSLCIVFVRPNLCQWMHWPHKAGKCHFRDEKIKQKNRPHSGMPKFTQEVCARPGNQALVEHLNVLSSPFGTAEIWNNNNHEMCPDTKKIITLMQIIGIASICVMRNQNRF